MAPSFDQLHEADLDDDDFDEDELDFSDLREKYEVQLDQGYDSFVVIDGLPKVTEEQKPKLIKFLLKKLIAVGKTSEDRIHMPMENGESLRFAFVEFSSPGEAAAAVRQLDMVPLDKKNTMRVNKITDIDRYGSEGKINDEYVPPKIDEFTDKEHLRSFLNDPSGRGRDQFVMYRNEGVGVFWNNDRDAPENIVDRQHWTEQFVQFSTQGTYLTSIHAQGVQLWGGASWSRQRRFAHPYVNLLAFSPLEKYLVTWSARPIVIPEDGHPQLSLDDDGKNYVIWDIETGKPLRSFANLDLPAQGTTEDGMPRQQRLPWPAFKWSADEKYVARLTPGQSISVYELPRMGLLDKTSIKIEGVQEFEWAPATPQRDGIKTYEQLFCYWSPEHASNPAKVGLMSIPSKQVVRTMNLFNVADCKLHWQSDASYVCVKVDKQSKSKKFQGTTLEIFRIKEKGVPVEVVDTVKDAVINFAWEPKGDRFVIISAGEAIAGAAVAPKTAVSFFAPEKIKGPHAGTFRHLRTLDKKNSNAIYWSPRGRFVVVATIGNTQSSDLDFFDLDYEGEKPESDKVADKELDANIQLMNIGDHYGVTDVEWDPSGRFVATWASFWKHTMENGYHIYDFTGEVLREEPVEKFKQWQWRPRPPTLLSKDEQKQIRKNLRQYAAGFEEDDRNRITGANQEVVDNRRRQLLEWLEWREDMEAQLAEEKEELGLPEDPVSALLQAKTEELAKTDDEQVIEELVEEVIDEKEEIVE